MISSFIEKLSNKIAAKLKKDNIIKLDFCFVKTNQEEPNISYGMEHVIFDPENMNMCDLSTNQLVALDDGIYSFQGSHKFTIYKVGNTK